MRDSALDEALTAIGYAKVIVALHPGDGGAPIGAAVAAMASTAAIPRRPSAAARRGVAVTASAASSLELDLQQHFIVPNEAQPLSLAAAVLRTDVTASRRSKAASKQPKSASPRLMRMYPHLRLAIGYVNHGGATALEADSRVASVVKAPELSLIRPVAARSATPGKVTSWGILRLGADKLWAAGFEGEGVVVGHLDTGVDGSHPALSGAIAAFAEFDMTGEPVPGAQPRDSAQHGTHTAGTIVGRSGPKGSFGVAPKAKLASGMVIEGGQTIDRILSGMDWIVEQGCHILSMSLGLRGYTPAFQTVIDSLRAAGVLPVIAVGNEGPLTSRSPGNYANVVSIGAIDSSDQVAGFSSSQTFNRPDEPLVPSLVAPGVGVVSCIPNGGFAEMDGTSMATPHIAGLAALLLGAKPGATVDELAQAILDSCRRPSGMPQDRANRGVPDAALAFKNLTGNSLPIAGVALGARRAPKMTRKKAARGAKPAKIRAKGPKTPAKRPAAAGRARRKP